MHTNTLFTQENSLLIINMLQTPNFLSTRSWEFVDRKLTSCQQTPNFLSKEKLQIFRFSYTA